MGYDIHITRAADWADRAPDREIGADQWLAYVSSDPSLTLDPATATTSRCGPVAHVVTLVACVDRWRVSWRFHSFV